MAAIDWDDVVAHAPESSTVETDAQTDILAYVNGVGLSVKEWGGESSARLRLGRIYLAAHFATLIIRGGGAIGPLVGESVGGVSAQYGSNSPTGTDPLLDKTSYGQMYRQLIRTSRSRAPFVV